MTQPFTMIGINTRDELQTPRYTVAFNRCPVTCGSFTRSPHPSLRKKRRRQSAIELKRKPHTAQAPK